MHEEEESAPLSGIVARAGGVHCRGLLAGQQLRKNDLTFAKIYDSLLQIPASHIVVALGVTIINYGILVFYDYLAFRFAKVPISLAGWPSPR